MAEEVEEGHPSHQGPTPHDPIPVRLLRSPPGSPGTPHLVGRGPKAQHPKLEYPCVGEAIDAKMTTREGAPAFLTSLDPPILYASKGSRDPHVASMRIKEIQCGDAKKCRHLVTFFHRLLFCFGSGVKWLTHIVSMA